MHLDREKIKFQQVDLKVRIGRSQDFIPHHFPPRTPCGDAKRLAPSSKAISTLGLTLLILMPGRYSQFAFAQTANFVPPMCNQQNDLGAVCQRTVDRVLNRVIRKMRVGRNHADFLRSRVEPSFTPIFIAIPIGLECDGTMRGFLISDVKTS